MPAVFTIPAVFKAVDKISATQKRMQKSVKNFSRSARADMQRASLAFQKFNNRVKSVGKRITKSIGSIGVAFAGLALIGVMGGMINVFADFEQANAGLAAVMNVTVKENRALTEDAKRLGSITAKTASEVVGLQEAFARLGFERQSILNMTQATIAGSIAMKAELADTAELVGAMVKTFDALSSRDAGLINDQMVKSTQKSALNFEKLSTALPIVGGAANSLKIPFTRTLALLGKLSDAGIDASMSATALRKIFTTSASKGVPYQKLLEQVANSENSLATATKLFGRTAAVQADILAKNLSGVKGLDLALQDAAGTAELAANKQLNTLQGRLTILGSAWEGFILSVESGDGKFAKFLKTTVEVATEILAMATGTSKLESKLSKSEKTIRILANRAVTFLKVIKWIIAAYVAFRAVMLLTNGVLFAYNVVMGISAAITGIASIAIGQSTVAMVAYKTITGLVTAAQWLWNAALLANPIGLVIVGVVALIAVVAIMINKWETWGAALAVGLGPLGMIISLIQSFRKNWDMIKESFKENGIIGGLKAIGAVILDSLLMPIQQVLELISKIPGMGDKMQPLIDKMQEFRRGLGVDVGDQKIINRVIPPSAANSFITSENKTEKIINKVIPPSVSNSFITSENKTEKIINKVLPPSVSNSFITSENNATKDLVNNFVTNNNATERLANNFVTNENTTKNLANNFVTNENNTNTLNQNNPVIASDFNKQQPQQNNSRVDLFLNNRSSDTEIFTEGTGVNVQKTGN